MDENLKKLMQQLGNAINESLSSSESVSEVMAEIREAGYDIFLILEATIGFHARRDREFAERAPITTESGDLVLNPQDAKWLKQMRITLSGSDSPSPQKE